MLKQNYQALLFSSTVSSKEDVMWSRLAVVSLVFVLYACAAPISTPSLNLLYTPTTRALGNNISIMLATPSYTGSPQQGDDANKEIGPDDTIPVIYVRDYLMRLQNSMQTDLEKIFIAKGFILARPSDSLGDIPSSDKQKNDLDVITTFDFGPQVTNYQKVLHYPTGNVVVMNEGTLALTGTLTMTYAEPLTKRAVIVKKFDMTSLSADIPIEYQDQTDAENKFTERINIYYPRLMAKIEKSINAEEILMALKNIRMLKEKGQPAP
jgi:hypothetical protein